MSRSDRSAAPALLSRLFRAERGVSAVEFSLLAPFLVIGGISMVDAGMAVYEKMMITQVLRSGAQGAISAETEASVLGILSATASDNFTVTTSTPGPGELGVAVSTYCVCPDAITVAVSCTSTCTAASPMRFYQMTASKEFAGIVLPDFTLSGSIEVAAR